MLAKKAMTEYLGWVLVQDKVCEFLDGREVKLVIPSLEVVLSCGPQVAGLTYGKRLIELSSWLVVDEDETYRVIRHEAAHVIKHACKLPGTKHGKQYGSALKIISPKTWQDDKHWHPNSKIEEARLKIHTTSKNLLRGE